MSQPPNPEPQTKVLITGTVGFIGFNLVNRLLEEGNFNIVGRYVINDYYNINLKYACLEQHCIVGRELKERDIQTFVNHLDYRFLNTD
ncbi:MAG: hypothetical protein VKN72_04390, partial [Nostocales cyanobacterium 94392]|nr:hypothetical protein [Nostocales cyanobacterium 94392]